MTFLPVVERELRVSDPDAAEARRQRARLAHKD